MSHIQRRPTRLLLTSLALFAASACGDSSGPGVPDDFGVLLVPENQAGGGRYGNRDLVWTRDGTELVYANNGLQAVSVSTHAVRQLDASPIISSFDRGSSGEWIYFAAPITTQSLTDPNLRLSRVNPTSGAAEILTTTFSTGYDGYMAVSADERFLAVGWRLLDFQTGVDLGFPARLAFGFSPDGTRLLCQSNETLSPTLISTADGSSLPLLFDHWYLAHRWEGNSPQLIKTDMDWHGGTNYTVRLSEIDGLTGAARDIAQFETTDFFLDPVWSPDGRTLAVWVEQDAKTNLYVIRSGGVPTVVASMTPRRDKGPGRPAFSPSGNSVAYFYYDDSQDNQRRSLYLKSDI